MNFCTRDSLKFFPQLVKWKKPSCFLANLPMLLSSFQQIWDILEKPAKPQSTQASSSLISYFWCKGLCTKETHSVAESTEKRANFLFPQRRGPQAAASHCCWTPAATSAALTPGSFPILPEVLMPTVGCRATILASAACSLLPLQGRTAWLLPADIDG